MKILAVLLVSLFYMIGFNGCSNEELGAGPIKEEIKLAPVDMNLSSRGKDLFTAKCMTCHRIDTRLLGPALKDVTKRRRPEWIMNQILNPAEMIQKDPVAKQLYAEYKIPMVFQDVSRDDARALLEYFRALDEGKQSP